MTDQQENFQKDDYDDEAWLNENVMPLIKQLHKLCHERQLPFIAAIAYGLDTKVDAEGKNQRYHMGGSCFLPANERVPPELALSQKLIFEGFGAAAHDMLAFGLAHAAGARESHTIREGEVPGSAAIN